MKRGRGATQPTQDTQDDFNLTQAQQGSQGDTAHFLEAGYIKDVRAVNFMCHSNLRAELSPFMNFIAGENGSGKSALLTAISFALGANAKQTNRSSEGGAKGLIKSGQEAAQIELTIANKGAGAYKPEVFGNAIVIERKITKTATLTIKDANGKKIPGKQLEVLQGILDFFLIDVKNPLNVMTQDMTRTFLAQCDPKALFAFYAKGTLLEDMRNGLYEVTQILDQIKSLIKDYAKDGPGLKVKVEELFQEVQQCQVLRQNKEQLDALRKRNAWATAAAAEAALATLVARRTDLNGYLQKWEEGLRDFAEIEGGGRARLEQAQAELAELMAEVKACADELGAAKALSKKRSDAAKKARFEVAAAEDEAHRHRAAAAAERAAKAAAERAVRDDDELVLTQAADEVNARAGVLGEAQAALQAALQEARDADAELGRCGAAGRDAANELQRAAAHNGQLLQEKQRLAQAAGDSLAIIRQNMPRLVQELHRRAREFSAPPVGPVGRHVRLIDPRFKLPVDEAIGRSLGDFVVNNNADAVLLRRIAQECQVNAVNVTIVWGRLGAPRHAIPEGDLPSAERTEGWFRMMDCITCDNDAIFNLLVDGNNIEKLIICESDQIARDMVWGGRCRNVKSAFLQDGTNYIARGGAHSMMRREGRFPPRIGTDLQQEQLRVDAQLAEIQATGRELEQAKNAAAEAYARARDVASAAHARAKQLAKRRDEADYLVGDAQRKSQQAARRAQPLSLDGYDRRVREHEEEAEAAEAAVAPLQAAAEAAEAVAAAAAEASAAVQPRRVAFKARVLEKQEEVERFSVQRQEREGGVAVLQGKINRAKAGAEKLDAQLAEAREKLAASLKHAEDHCSREEAEAIPIDPRDADKEAALTPAELVERLGKTLMSLERSIAKEEERHGRPLDDIERDHGRAKKRLKTFHRNVEACKTPLRKLVAELKKSNVRIEECKELTQAAISLLFNSRLAARGHGGRMLIDYNNESLELNVDFSGRKNKVEDLKSLSGGERSFVQLAYVLSLAEKAEGPFRAMDEWDVFMDAMNRKISFQTLLKFAKDHKNVQFILLTPQDISAVEIEDGVKILRMQAARK